MKCCPEQARLECTDYTCKCLARTWFRLVGKTVNPHLGKGITEPEGGGSTNTVQPKLGPGKELHFFQLNLHTTMARCTLACMKGQEAERGGGGARKGGVTGQASKVRPLQSCEIHN